MPFCLAVLGVLGYSALGFVLAVQNGDYAPALVCLLAFFIPAGLVWGAKVLTEDDR